MSAEDWADVIDQLAAIEVETVQFIGGEPTLHPALPSLIEHALARGLQVEVYSNLVHVPRTMWPVLERPGVSVATSYYSDDPGEHAAVTGRPSYARTRANIAEAVRRGVPVRAGIVDVRDGQRTAGAHAELQQLGVADIGVDRLRGVGRGAHRIPPDVTQLCGHCISGVIAIAPDGAVWPCVFSRWLPIGNVLEAELTAILAGPDAARVHAELEAEFASREPGMICVPDMCDPQCGPSCGPACVPQGTRTPCAPRGGCRPNYGRFQPASRPATLGGNGTTGTD
jgi:MoaA/NifB/PqqE/SkfB family radical SAM enzyme